MKDKWWLASQNILKRKDYYILACQEYTSLRKIHYYIIAPKLFNGAYIYSIVDFSYLFFNL